MQIKEITENIHPHFNSKSESISHEQLQREYDYYRAEKLLKKLFVNGFITEDEFKKVTLINRQTLSPLLAPLMPDNT